MFASKTPLPSGVARRHLAGRRRGVGHGLVGLLDEDVERDVEVDGAGTPGAQQCERLAQHERQLVGARGLEAALHVRAHDAREVGLVVAPRLLERPAVELAGRHVARDREEGGGVHQRRAERHREVRRARPARRQRRDRLAADAEPRVGHEPRDGLVVDGDRRDLVAAVVQGVEHPEVAVAAHGEHVRDALADEVLGDDPAAAARLAPFASRFMMSNRLRDTHQYANLRPRRQVTSPPRTTASGLLIGGEWVEGGEPLAVLDKYSGETRSRT